MCETVIYSTMMPFVSGVVWKIGVLQKKTVDHVISDILLLIATFDSLLLMLMACSNSC